MKSLEIISIHINKTAGKSFRSVLCDNYGTRLFNINVDDSDKEHRSLSCKSDELIKRIPDDARAIHGHFTAKQIIPILNKKPVPIIVWLRDPIERVISNYFHDLNNGYTKSNIFRYVCDKDNTNRISKMLDGISLDKYTIGFQNRFNDDVKRMARLFGWVLSPSAPMLNVGKKGRVSFCVRQVIKAVNGDDINLYKRLLGVKNEQTGIRTL